MKLNQWTSGLVSAGVISLGSAVQAEEAQHQVMTAVSSTTLSGYVDTSAIWKFGTGNVGLPGRSYDGPGKQDGFNLNVAKVSLEKPLDEGTWSAGYKADLLFGPDANAYATTSTGATTSDFGIQQAYVNLRAPAANGLDIQVGVWDTVIGYEVFDSYKNPNYSRSYGFAIEPKTHTGVLASYQFNDIVALKVGVANTASASTINARSARAVETHKTYMALLSLTAPDDAGFLKGASLFAGVIDGFGAVGGDQVSWYVGTTIPTPVDGLTIGASYDYRARFNPAFGATSDTYANAAAGYVSYQATEKLRFSGRAEYASGTAGTWGAKPFAGPNNEEFFGVTATADYKLWENVVTRAELRWDADVSGGPKSFGGGPGADPDRNALSLALNVVYKF